LGNEECDKLDEEMWAGDDEEPVKVTVNDSCHSTDGGGGVDGAVSVSNVSFPVHIDICGQ